MPRLCLALTGLLVACSTEAGRIPPPPAVLGHTVRTEHFVLYTDLDEAERDFHARLFEAFRTWFCDRYFTLPGAKPLPVYLFSSPEDFEEFNRRIGGPDSYGYFAMLTNGEPILVANLATGLGTALHELVHAFLHVGYQTKLPRWFDEGFAAYHEKCLGHLDGTKLDVSFGYFSNWRFPRLKAEVVADRVTLARLLDPEYDPTSASRSLMLFLERRDRFVPLVRAMREATQDDGMRTLAEAWGNDLADLETQWLAWIREQPLDDEVGLVPQAKILSTSEWSAWLATQQARLRWSEELRRFVPATAK